MVWWHIWPRVTGRWVTVTGKRREPDLPVTSCSASPAAVATPCPVLAAPHAACRLPDCAAWGRELRWHRRCCPWGRRPPGRLSLPRTAGKRCRRLPVSRARHPVLLLATGLPGRCTSLGERNERLKAAPGTFHHAPVKARPHGVADCPAAGEQQAPDGRQVNPAAGGSAGTEGRRACPAGDCPPAPPVPLTGGQDFLARPRARPRDNDNAPRGLLDLSWTCRRPAADLTPRRRAGCAGQISLSPAHPRGESHSQMEGFQIEGGPTPYPHIALCATAPKLISGRRTGRTPSDVQKRCLPPRAAAGPEWPRGQNQA